MAERVGMVNGEDPYVAWSRSHDESEILAPRFGGTFVQYAAGGAFAGALLGPAHEMSDNTFDGLAEVATGAGAGLMIGFVAKTLLYLGYMGGSLQRGRSMYIGSPTKS